MHALLLTMLALTAGPDGMYGGGRITQSSADIYGTQGGISSGCDTCGQSGCGGHLKQPSIFSGERTTGWFGHMPQTCYDPRYGCYQGNNRHMNRYPAFAGTYYRRPYNYRNVFDYPWHAEMHEPTSMFSYNTVPETGATDVRELGESAIPAPIVSPQEYEAARRAQPQSQYHQTVAKVVTRAEYEAAKRQQAQLSNETVGSGVMNVANSRVQGSSRRTTPPGRFSRDAASPNAVPHSTLRR